MMGCCGFAMGKHRIKKLGDPDVPGRDAQDRQHDQRKGHCVRRLMHMLGVFLINAGGAPEGDEDQAETVERGHQGGQQSQHGEHLSERAG